MRPVMIAKRSTLPKLGFPTTPHSMIPTSITTVWKFVMLSDSD